MGKQLLFLDFDETLFNHMAYLKWLEDFLKKYGVKPGSFLQEIDEFHEIKGENMRLYDHAGHMYRVSGKDWDYISGEVESALMKNEQDFCYPDVHDFLDSIINLSPRILTYGNGEYQRFKIGRCKHIKKLHIPVHVVNRAKGEFLKKEFPDQSGVLIDDKTPLYLPANWLHVYINRKEELANPKITSDRQVQINNLTQVISALSYFSCD